MITNKEKYRKFCKKEINIPIFSKDWWLDSVCGEDNWNVNLVEINGHIVASLPYYKSKKAIFDIITMPKLTQTMGVYIKYPPRQKYATKLSFEKKIMTQLINNLPDVDYFSQFFHYNFTNWLPFYWKGFQQTTRYTYVIEDLSNLDKVFENFGSDYRTKIRNAQKKVTIKQNLNIEDFYNINMMSFERQNIKPPYSLEFLKEHNNYLSQNNAKEIFYAIDDNNNIHSALYLTWDNKYSYTHILGENPQLRNSGAGILLIWEAIKYTRNTLGLNNFNFEGSMIEGVEQVRRKFGAVQKPYLSISKSNNRLFKFAKLFKDTFK